MRGWADRYDVLWAVALSALTIISRLPYRARMLYNWDAVQFALALTEYDITKHQPHPPGYILYVMMGHAFNVWLRDASAAYVTLAVIVSGCTTFAVYFLARAIYDRATAVAAAALLAVSPLFWFYGSVGLTYAAEALAASTLAYFAYRALAGSESHVYLGALYLGLAGGVRQSILVLFFPLWFCTAAVGVGRIRALAIGAGLVALAALSWFLPMIWLTGGLARYLEASVDLAELMVRPTVVGTTSPAVTLAQARYLLETIAVGLGPLALAILVVPLYARRFGWGRREWFLVGWTVPPVLVYTLVHFGQAGYVLTFLPALVILLARVLLAVVTDQARRVPHAALRYGLQAGTVCLILLVNGSFFVNARPSPRDFETMLAPWQRRISDDASDWIWSRTAPALREHEAVVRTFVESIRGQYDPADTAVVTELGNPRSYPWLRHAMFYLREYPIYQLRVDAQAPNYYAPRLSSTMSPIPDSQIHLPAGVRRLVWFVDHWSPTLPRPASLTEIELPHGRFLYVLVLERRPVEYAGYTFVPDGPRRDGPPAR